MNGLLHIREAYTNLLSSKLRSFLAILGILVGTASVVAMVSSGHIATQHALDQFAQLGTDLLAVSVFSENNNQNSSQQNTEFSLNDARNIQEQNTDINEIAPYTSLFQEVVFSSQRLDASTIGATQALQRVINIQMQRGRFISDFDKYTPFCVIGSKIAEEMKSHGVTNPLDTQIQIGDKIFTVVGVAAPWPENSFFSQDINKSVIIPIQSSVMLSRFSAINNLIIQLKPDADIDAVQNHIRAYITQHLSEKRLFFRSARQLIESMTSQKHTLTLLLALIGSISLIVGGIGVMNIMLVSVVERRREIGIRMAVGARRRDIRTLFLIEAIVLTLFGGIVGVIIGILASYVISIFAGWHFRVFLLPPLIGFAVSVAVGVFFGFYPAYTASKLDPIQTLREN